MITLHIWQNTNSFVIASQRSTVRVAVLTNKKKTHQVGDNLCFLAGEGITILVAISENGELFLAKIDTRPIFQSSFTSEISLYQLFLLQNLNSEFRQVCTPNLVL